MRQWEYALSTADEAPETAPILLKGTICDNLKKASELGYQAIEIHMREDEEIDCEEIKRTMRDYHIKISQIITGRLNTEGKCSLMADEPYITAAAMS
jgi:predicted regulator of amino acid metabolism with ACT domain